MKRRLISLVLLLLLLVGCAPEEGTVKQKQFVAEHYNDWVSFMCVVYASNGTCASQMPIFHHDYVPPDWQVYLVNGEDEGWVSVSQYDWDRLETGSYYKEKD